MTTSVVNEPQSRVEVRAVAAERLAFFVDAVIAIALTLLALDLPVPSGQTNAAMLHSVGDHGGEYIAFVVSFLVIAAHWRAHHDIFRYVNALGGRLTSLTLTWLFMLVVMPFATRVLTSDGAFQTRFSCYALIQVLASGLMALMVGEIGRRRLYSTTVPPAVFRQSAVRSVCLAAVFAASIPLSLLTTRAYLCWLAAPVVLGVARTLLERRASR
jgi:uncharacterized membrane protein